jgi:hypothetical protein
VIEWRVSPVAVHGDAISQVNDERSMKAHPSTGVKPGNEPPWRSTCRLRVADQIAEGESLPGEIHAKSDGHGANGFSQTLR